MTKSILIAIAALVLYGSVAVGQEKTKSKLSYLLDDTYVISGINNSGIMYSRHFRELSPAVGFNFGIEQYIPAGRKLFFNVGLHYAQRNFNHNLKNEKLQFNNHYLDLPASIAIELPILRQIDFRIIFGSDLSFRLKSNTKQTYPNNHQQFRYQIDGFNPIDFGWHFGISGEYNRWLFRFRQFSGFVKLDPNDQGMLYSTNIEIGYFLLRRNK